MVLPEPVTRNLLVNFVKDSIIPTVLWFAFFCLYVFDSAITASCSLASTNIWADLELAAFPHFVTFLNVYGSRYTIDSMPWSGFWFTPFLKGNPLGSISFLITFSL